MYRFFKQVVIVLVGVFWLVSCSHPLLTPATPLPTQQTTPTLLPATLVNMPNSNELVPTADLLETGCQPSSVRVSVQDWNGKPLDALPAFLFAQLLEECKGSDIVERYRLLDYQIENVSAIGYVPDKILATVHFSVKPVKLLYSDWQAGSGEGGYVGEGDGWIRNKVQNIAVLRGSEWYALE